MLFRSQDPMIRQNDMQVQNIAFNNIYRNLVLEVKKKADYIIYMGDLNYRLKVPTDGIPTAIISMAA